MQRLPGVPNGLHGLHIQPQNHQRVPGRAEAKVTQALKMLSGKGGVGTNNKVESGLMGVV